MTDLTPREIVAHLDRFIVGQDEAKRAVAVALRSRWRRRQLADGIRDEVFPKNILMIGPTGVGKTEISRRLARLAQAPFVKVEATKFTEVGYVGRDVEQIIRDLVDAAVAMTRETMRGDVREQAQKAAEDRVLDAVAGPDARGQTREMFRRKLHAGELDHEEISIEVADTPTPMMPFEVPGQPGMGIGAINIGEVIGKAFGQRRTQRRMSVADSHAVLLREEADRMIDEEAVTRCALRAVEDDGIVFIDEIDKVCSRATTRGDVSREGVQRDLLPLIEGSSVSTRHGQVNTDHVLFIASGAFHLAKPSDLLPELQGRLPIRVTLSSLGEEDFRKILVDPDNALARQYSALMETEGVEVSFSDCGIKTVARVAAEVNQTVENIGARRLHTVLERVFEDLSFAAPERRGDRVEVDAAYVEARIATLLKSGDSSRYIL